MLTPAALRAASGGAVFSVDESAIALLIPPGYGTASFDHRDAALPALRVTNAGFLAVTIEIDCKDSR